MLFSLTVISHTEHLGDLSIEKVESLLKQLPISNLKSEYLSVGRVLDYTFENEKSLEDTRAFLRDNLVEGVDLVYQVSETRRDKKLFVFDMDSTLIYQEVIELIAAYANVELQVAEITTRAMNGELDFKQSLLERVKLLKGINSTKIWDELYLNKIQITNGVEELSKGLKTQGCKLAVLSGGFIPLAQKVASKLGFDYAYANNLGFDVVDGQEILNGVTFGRVVDGEMKKILLQEIAETEKIDLQNVVAIGDGANDLKMMSVAGLGIAWNAKPKVQQAAPCCLNTKSMKDVFYILGYKDDEIASVL